MIFVTVGTHEQQFDRLIKEIDRLKDEDKIQDEVFIQTGFSTYEPKHCKWSKLISYREMDKMIREARIVITHGGPASFIAPLQIGKIPIVVPRQKQYNEHVNNHQLEFLKQVERRFNNIIPIYDISELEEKICDYNILAKKMKENYKSNNDIFVKKLEEEIEEIFSE